MQLLFVSVVSKVISDGIFNECFLKIKNVGKVKNVKKTYKRDLNKNVKNVFFYIYGTDGQTVINALCPTPPAA